MIRSSKQNIKWANSLYATPTRCWNTVYIHWQNWYVLFNIYSMQCFLWWYVLVWHTGTFFTCMHILWSQLKACSLSASVRHACWHLFVSRETTDIMYFVYSKRNGLRLQSGVINANSCIWWTFKNSCELAVINRKWYKQTQPSSSMQIKVKTWRL